MARTTNSFSIPVWGKKRGEDPHKYHIVRNRDVLVWKSLGSSVRLTGDINNRILIGVANEAPKFCVDGRLIKNV